ncbi:transposable element Tc1 transposase [Trichonephila clavipes]|nr:transposable element Tc1 transposase [Trichonephila clavipes]
MPGKRARRHFSQLSEFQRGLIIGMKTACWSTRRVAGQVDRMECALRHCWEQWTQEGTYAWKTGSGATRKTTRREDRRIERKALVDPTVTRSTIRADVGVAIVPQTFSRHLGEANLKSRRPFRALPLTPEHRQLRLQWCQARSMWNVTDWQKVVFSDEFLFGGQMTTVYGCGDALNTLVTVAWEDVVAHWLWSQTRSRRVMIRSLMPMKPRVVEEPMHFKSPEAQSTPINVMWKFGERLPAQMCTVAQNYGLSPIALLFYKAASIISHSQALT